MGLLLREGECVGLGLGLEFGLGLREDEKAWVLCFGFYLGISSL